MTLTNPTPQANPFGPGVVNFACAPNFAPTRIATPGPNGFPLAKFAPGAVAGPGYSPFIRFKGSGVVYNAPIVAVGNGPFDVTHHTNTGDRVLGIHIAGKSKPGQFAESWADLLFVKGFDAGQPIVYLSTDAGQPLTAVLERSTYVPALNNAAFKGVNTLLSGSLRAEERARQPEHHPVGTPVGEVRSARRSNAATCGPGSRSSCSPDRPNPIGVHRAQILAVEGLAILAGSCRERRPAPPDDRSRQTPKIVVVYARRPRVPSPFRSSRSACWLGRHLVVFGLP